ncbi:MAG TPA: peptide-methionine (S)-S-oxide reductase MsrA [Leptospiraceae bacterium]|nr:peptide-methionine (S)-S-oxide reductase MsrA [Leptospiraceae bacterium]HMW07647.1 peptide-methionine (S)-S-oxide reductase MsrA [Leptospiraceae bacterium]HMX33997.1 peptide-methionine (S)-S-oxide reductase MsrA [Leptospiraceae bacterium]HMY33234.1 peptide-methionine (S)-S-oxide reductase MsrA [Leptospiraceae bacterium]HMZ65740.1 peptide-methionine (S)-S-oxide reductase MsrA [Leptospiraceae bacterium]
MKNKIVLGGGCFWCLEAVYQLVEGVTSVVSGYAGGHKINPTYKEVCDETTGHAEVVQLEFDSEKTSLSKLLEIFWKIHDPTTLNRQGNDVGTQYRSIILYEDANQKEIAEASKKDAQSNWNKPIVTEIVPLTTFYPAEDYHQNYFNNNPYNSYCAYVVKPKVDKFKKSLSQ